MEREEELYMKYIKIWPRLVDREIKSGYTQLKMDIDGKEFTITLLNQAAPTTCKEFIATLPLEGNFIHAAWSGDAIRQLEEFVLPNVTEFENGTYYPAPGDVCYTLGHKEFTIIYGDCDPRMPYGKVRLEIFGRITENLMEFQRICKLIRLAGAKKFKVSIKR